MIVPMKKATIIVQAKDADSAVKDLRKLGVLHVEHQNLPQGKDISLLQEEIGLINSLPDVLKQAASFKKNNRPGNVISADWKAVVRHIIELWKRYEQLEAYSEGIINQINEWQRWGDFDHQEIEHLSQKGVYLKLYQLPLKQIKDFPDDVVVKNIFTVAGISHCAVISRRQFVCPLKEIPPPKQSLSWLKKRFSEDKKAMEAIKNEITQTAYLYEDLLEIKKDLEKEVEFQQVLSGMGQEGPIAYVAGYIPFDLQQRLVSEAKTRKWGIITEDPSDEDNVPTLIRNPRWVSLINPVFKLMEAVPGYRELDVSPLFLLFLSLFFGMIIGDAGYGAVYFLLTFLAQRKLGGKVKDKSVFFLFYLFSSCAIMWGLLTGTLFGQQWYLALGFKALAPALNEAKFLMSFCFLIGALQLSLAHGWQAIVKLPSLKALADVGFICLLWVGYFLAKMFIVGDPFPVLGKWLIWAGVLFIIFFSNPQKNMFKAALEGLGVLALGLMGNFGDVVSYIRLFAMGLAGVAVADSVNSLAAGASNILAQIIILFIGHTINIMLGPISVLVHGIRLNVLEFSVLHGNVTWSGLAYKPLKS